LINVSILRDFEKKSTETKKKLNNIVKRRNKNKKDFKENLRVYEKLYSLQNEYMIAKIIDEVTPIAFTNDEGIADFEIMSNGILIDAKIRLVNDKPVYIDKGDVTITFKTVFSLLMRDGLSQIENSFDRQNCDIVMVNLSKSSAGFVLGTGFIIDLSFDSTMNLAIEMVKHGEKAVILYSVSRGINYDIFSICFKKDILLEIGKRADKIDKLLSAHNKKTFYEFASYINDLDIGEIKNF
jgi:hypothetical protein